MPNLRRGMPLAEPRFSHLTLAMEQVMNNTLSRAFSSIERESLLRLSDELIEEMDALVLAEHVLMLASVQALRAELEAEFGASMIGFAQAGAGATAWDVEDRLQESIFFLGHVPPEERAAIKDGTTIYNATAALESAIAEADGRPVILPEGDILVENVTAVRANLIGMGEGVTRIKLFGDGTGTLLNIDQLRTRKLTLDDRGRSSMDHTTNAAVVLVDAVDIFDAMDVEFKTDRSVLLQSAATDASYASVLNTKLTRVNAPLVNEEDAMNLFVMSQVKRLHFAKMENVDLVGRSVINATYSHAVSGVNTPALAVIEDNIFDFFRLMDISGELKTVFLQGYLSLVQHNQFVDCFGRHVDVLGNYSVGTANGTHFRSLVSENKVDYTTANAAAQGADNDESGSLYCRYADAMVFNNHQDFTNLALVSNTYHGISIRHGYRAAAATFNTVINPKGHAVLGDISDSIDTDNSRLTISDNTALGATNASRAPYHVVNNSSTKLFDYVGLHRNTAEYTAGAYMITVDAAPGTTGAFAFEAMSIRDNWHNTTVPKMDSVNFLAFPKTLDAPNISVTIAVDPAAAVSTGGVMNSLSDALACMSRYRCNSLTVELDGSVVTDQTYTTTNFSVKPKNVTIDGNNGLGGRIRFYTDGAQQTGLALALDGNNVVLDGTKHESDAGVSTTSLIRLTGHGHCKLNIADGAHGEAYVLTTGPDVSIKGGTANNINLGSTGSRGIIYVDADRLVRVSIDGLTGTNNHRLYNCFSPAIIVTDDIAGLTLAAASVKTFTVVT